MPQRIDVPGMGVVEFPDGMTDAQIVDAIKRNSAPERSLPARIGQQVGNYAGGLVRGAGSLGATILAPLDIASDALAGKGLSLESNRQRRASMDEFMRDRGVETDSLAYGAGKLTTELGGTLGVGGALAKGAAAVPGVAKAVPNLLTSIGSAGMKAGPAATGIVGGTRNALTRAAGGAITGGASAGLVNPDDAGTGALVGGLAPGAMKLAGAAGNLVGRGARAAVGTVSPDVAALAKRAKALGIEIPADRLVDSKPLDAVASGLNYVPFSGRASTERKMGEQLNRAASRLMGQDTPNINKALRDADVALGAKFETTLKSTGVQFDKQLLDDVSAVYNTAQKELGSDALKAISSQLDDLIEKGRSGVIDGQAAYNIKRTLDRIGRRNAPEAFHALELKRALMDGLNRSLGPDGARAFAATRQQYGNMLALEKLAKNGVEGEISVARLANLRNINNEPLQELADIAAQFVKPREGQHGAMQRAVVGLTAGAAGGPLGLAATVATGRAGNTALNSNVMRQLMLGERPNALRALTDPRLQQLGYRAAPVASGDR